VTNILGERVVSEVRQSRSGMNEFRLDLMDLESGVYYLNISSGQENKQIKKIIKQ